MKSESNKTVPEAVYVPEMMAPHCIFLIFEVKFQVGQKDKRIAIVEWHLRGQHTLAARKMGPFCNSFSDDLTIH